MSASSLVQVKMGTEALALCIAGVLCERDPSLLAAFQERVEMLYHELRNEDKSSPTRTPDTL